MCDRYSSHYGYICWECFEELVGLGVETDIEAFMGSERKPIPKVDANAFFEEIFPER
jgi:hypothetical protein